MGKEKAELIHIAERFAMEGEIGSIEAHGNGHINDTFLVTCQMAEGKTRRYILQRMNQEVFKNPKELMENVTGVTTFLQNKIRENGGDPEREALNVILLKDGGSYGQEENNTSGGFIGLWKGLTASMWWNGRKNFMKAPWRLAGSRNLCRRLPRASCNR